MGHLRRGDLPLQDIHRTQPLLGVMDITVERNAFGRQVDSFETELEVPELSRGGSAVPALSGGVHSRPH